MLLPEVDATIRPALLYTIHTVVKPNNISCSLIQILVNAESPTRQLEIQAHRYNVGDESTPPPHNIGLGACMSIIPERCYNSASPALSQGKWRSMSMATCRSRAIVTVE